MSARKAIGEGLFRKGNGGTIYARIAIPRWAVPHAGQRELLRSLHTESLREAEERRERLVEALDLSLALAQRAIERPEELTLNEQATVNGLSDADILRYSIDDATEWLQHAIIESEEPRPLGRPGRPAQESVGDLAAVLAQLSTLSAQVAVLAAGSNREAAALAGVARSLERRAHRARPLRELVDRWLATKATSGAKSALHQYELVARELVERLGADATVDDVTFDALEAWKAAWTGSGRSIQAFRDQRLRFVRHMIVTVGRTHGLVADATVGAVERAVKAAGLAINARDASRSRGSETPTREELAKIFNPSWADDRRPGYARQRAQFGDASRLSYMIAPCIAALSGMRCEEVAQLRAGDVRAVGGIECFVIEPHPGGWKPKTQSSERVVPVHEAMRGLLGRLVDGKAADQFVLDGLAISKGRGKRGDQLGHAFTKRVKKVLPGRKISLHGLRKWFAHELAEAEVPGDARDTLMGHAGPAIRSLYAGRAGVARLAEAVALLDASPVEGLVARINNMLEEK